MATYHRKHHWETIYNTKSLDEVSWFEPIPKVSLNLISLCELPKEAKIIDVGGGDSYFVDHLLELGYNNLTVLDISESAIKRAKKRLGKLADKVHWIITDINTFTPITTYDFWHDRASFHFLTDSEDINNYVKLTSQFISKNGYLAIGTFSENGPLKCSGVSIKQYSIETLKHLFNRKFSAVKHFNFNHLTPFDTKQNFSFCLFKRLKND